MKNTNLLTTQSLLWKKFALAQGAGFNIDQKAADALTFSADSNAYHFAVPSKLEGTSRFQDNIRYVLPRLDPASRNLSADVTPERRITVGFGMYTLGFVRRKHECWVRPLVEAGPCLFYLLQVTGGTEGKHWRGVNIFIHNLTEAIQMCAFHMDLGRFARLVA